MCTLHQISPQISKIILGVIIAIFFKNGTGFGELDLLSSSWGQQDTEHLISNPCKSSIKDVNRHYHRLETNSSEDSPSGEKRFQDAQRYKAKRKIKPRKIIINRRNKTRIKWLK